MQTTITKMTGFFKGMQLIMTGSKWIYIYPLAITAVLAAIACGFNEINPEKAELWGKGIPPMGVPGDSIRFCYKSFVYHFWCIAMMTLSFGGMKQILATWNPTFLNFVRFSMKGKIYLEILRLECFTLVMAVITAPFFAAAAIGCFKLGMTMEEACEMLYCIIPSLVLTGVIIYIAGACKLPDYYSGLFFTLPLILTGTQMFLTSREIISPEQWFLPLTPYNYLTPGNIPSSSMVCVVVITVVFICVRIALALNTARISQGSAHHSSPLLHVVVNTISGNN